MSSLPGGKRLLRCPQSHGLHRVRHRDRPHLCLAGVVRLHFTSYAPLLCFISLTPSISQSQHGRLQAGEAEWSHQTGGHRHHLHRSASSVALRVRNMPFSQCFFRMTAQILSLCRRGLTVANQVLRSAARELHLIRAENYPPLCVMT